jgi:hypothetical protein
MHVSDRGDAFELVVTGRWTAEASDAVRAGDVDRLVLNHALGFDEPSLAFLEGLPVRELVIVDPRLSDLAPVHSLGATLHSLSVTTNPDLKVDLSQLPKLRSISAHWSQVAETVASARGVEVASLRSYGAADLMPLAPLERLVHLVMKDRPRLRSLNGLGNFPDLRLLEVYVAKDLSDIDALRNRSGLQEIALEGCRKIGRIDVLRGCVGLRRLNLSDCGELASLGPIRDLGALESLLVYGSTRIADNDLSPIAGLPRLRQLRMQSRRPYRPSVEEIQAVLPRE